jgi:hypothetical protein
MADDAESSEKQNFIGEKKKSHSATRHCSETVYMLLVLGLGVAP